LRDFVISLAPFVKQSRTLHTLTAGPKTGVHFREDGRREDSGGAPATASEVGVASKAIFEARQVRDAEQARPGAALRKLIQELSNDWTP
jgi:hypothetical protein